MKIALLGDMAFYGKYSLDGNKGVYKYFDEVARFLQQYDYVVGNLETPFATDQKPSGAKSAYIKADPSNVNLLKYLNVNIVNLANNHIFDYGKAGFILTKNILNDNNISFFGIEDQQIYLEHDDNRIALHGYCCYSTNPLGMNTGGGVNELVIPTVENNLQKNAATNYFNIVSIHCGQEHVNYPNYDTIVMARQFAKICPYVFYGHHPHVMQGVETIDDSLICYSLGNFCFDDVYTGNSKNPLVVQSENNRTSYILELEFENNALIRHKIIPLYAGNDSLVVNSGGVIDKLTSYSAGLSQDKASYVAARNKLLGAYFASRKQLRDLSWFLKRFRLRYALIIVLSYLNRRKYNKYITSYLDKGKTTDVS